MELIDRSKLKELTNDEIKNLIVEVLEEIKFYKKLLNNSRNKTKHDNTASMMLLRNDYMTADFGNDDLYEEELNKLCEAVNGYVVFYERRLKFEKLKKEEIYHDYKCPECSNLNDLNLTGSSDVCLEFRGFCHYCSYEINESFSKNLY